MSIEFRHPNGIYDLVIPDDWRYEMRDSSVILSKADDREEAVVVSCVAPPSGESPDPHAFIQDFVTKTLPPEDDRGVRIAELPSQSPGIQIINTSYRAKGDIWRIWVVSSHDRLLFVTHNCRALFQGIEDHVVDRIIASARFP